jgi:dTDP-4-dehydrorhamnose 3,5-epimerase
MIVEKFAISGPLLIVPKRISDDRGFFSEVFNARALQPHLGDVTFVQDNHSHSVPVGTVRGLHFQANPTAQGKLVRATRGAVFDVAVDLRKNSPTYGQHVSAMLSAANWAQLWVPAGFAHGFCTTEPDTEVQYKVTDYYSHPDDRGLAWDDPALGIKWPVAHGDAMLSDKDRKHPHLADLPAYFS